MGGGGGAHKQGTTLGRVRERDASGGADRHADDGLRFLPRAHGAPEGPPADIHGDGTHEREEGDGGIADSIEVVGPWLAERQLRVLADFQRASRHDVSGLGPLPCFGICALSGPAHGREWAGLPEDSDGRGRRAVPYTERQCHPWAGGLPRDAFLLASYKEL